MTAGDHSINPVALEHRLTALEAADIHRMIALSTQAQEYARRLDDQGVTLSHLREDMAKRLDAISEQLAGNSGRDRGVATAFSVGVAIAGIVFGVATLVSRL